MHHNHLTSRNAIFGRIGRKFPEHFIGEGGTRCGRDQVSKGEVNR